MSDVVDAFVSAAGIAIGDKSVVMNIGGGEQHTLLRVIEVLSLVMDRPLQIDWDDPQHGDVRHTGADLSLAESLLNLLAQR